MCKFAAFIFVYPQGAFSADVKQMFMETAFQAIPDDDFMKKLLTFLHCLENQKDVIIEIKSHSQKEEELQKALKCKKSESLIVYDSVSDLFSIEVGDQELLKHFD